MAILTAKQSVDHRAIKIAAVGYCIGAGAIAAFFVSCIWFDFLKFFLHIDFNRETVFASALVAAAASALLRGWKDLRGRLIRNRWAVLVALYFAIAAVMHLVFGLPAQGSNVAMYAAPVAALIFLFVDLRVMLVLLIATIAISTLIQIEEFYELRYLFIWSDEHIALDAYQYTAGQGMFRAKGMFSGPVNGYAVELLALLFLALHPAMIVMTGISSVLAATKSGIIASAAVLVLRYFDMRRPVASAMMVIIMVAGFLATAQLVRLRTGETYDRNGVVVEVKPQNIPGYLSSITDLRVSATSDRLKSLIRGITDFGNFSPLHMTFGDPNFSYRIPDYLDRGVESSIEKELQDYGIVGFIIATAVKVAVFSRLFRSAPKMAIAFAGYCGIAMLSPIFTPFGFCVLLWIFMLKTISDQALP